MNPFSALLVWILLLHPPDHHAEVCSEMHLNSSATSIHMNKTFPKYNVKCLIPPGAMVIIKNRKIYKEEKVQIQFHSQSLILRSDPRPTSCMLIWTDLSGDKHTENCVIIDAGLSIDDKTQTALPRKTDTETSPVGGGSTMRERSTLCYISVFMLIGIALIVALKRKTCKCKKRSHSADKIECLMVQPTRSATRLNSHTWHGKSQFFEDDGDETTSLLEYDPHNTWHCDSRNLMNSQERNNFSLLRMLEPQREMTEERDLDNI